MSGQENEYDKQRRHAYHQSALTQQDEGGEAAEILHTLSNIDDLPIDPKDDPVMGQLVSKLTSTANLSKEDVRSNKWVESTFWSCTSVSTRPTRGCLAVGGAGLTAIATQLAKRWTQRSA